MITASGTFLGANAALQKEPIYLIEIDTYTFAFTNKATDVTGQRDWLEEIDDLTLTVNDLDGGADLGDLVFTVIDTGRVITSSFPTFTFEGKVVTLKTGFVGQVQADFCLLFTGVVDKVESVNSNNSYKFTCVDNNHILNKVIYTVGDNGLPTSSDNLKTINGHPLDILLDVLLTQVGLAAGKVDSAKIQEYRDGIFSGTQFQFTLDTAPAAIEFIQSQLLKPLGGYLWPNSAGKLSVNFIYPNTTVPVFALTEDNIKDIPEAQQADLVNELTFRFDKDDTTYMAEAVQQSVDSVAKYGQYGQSIVESDGMRSGLQGFFLANVAASIIFQRYGFKALLFTDIELLWAGLVLEAGDLVTVTHAQIPDRTTGKLGITAKQFIVLDRTLDFRKGVVKPKLIDASYITKFVAFKVSPDGEADYPSASSGDKAKYMFLCNDSDQYSTAAAGNTLG